MTTSDDQDPTVSQMREADAANGEPDALEPLSGTGGDEREASRRFEQEATGAPAIRRQQGAAGS